MCFLILLATLCWRTFFPALATPPWPANADVPDPPQMPVFTAFTQRSVNISWVPSYDYHYSPILHYIIHVREGVDGQWDTANGIMTPDNRTQFEIIGLKPFTTYSFRVLAVNSIGVSEPSPMSHYIITLRQKPDSRLNIISAKNASSSSIRLEWLSPSKNEIHGEFLGYRIKYVVQNHEHAPPVEQQNGLNGTTNNNRGSSNFYTTTNNRQGASSSTRATNQPTLDGPQAKEIVVGDPSQTSFTIKGLQTFTPYKISVQVSNPAGDGPVAEVLAMTDEGGKFALSFSLFSFCTFLLGYFFFHARPNFDLLSMSINCVCVLMLQLRAWWVMISSQSAKSVFVVVVVGAQKKLTAPAAQLFCFSFFHLFFVHSAPNTHTH